MIIKISIENKRPSVEGAPVIVCGNSDYVIQFTFDEEWSAHAIRTARFVFYRDGATNYQDVAFSGSDVAVPVLSGIREVYVGVYAGELRTTTPAKIPCDRSILCGTGVEHEEPDPDVYLQILEAVNDLVGAAGSHPARTDNPHNVTAAQVGARPDTWTPTAEQVGARPDTWTPTAEQVGARPDTWMPTAEQVGARPDTWMPTAEQVGARPNNWTPTAEEVGARPDTWMPSLEDLNAAPGGYGLGTAQEFTAAEINDLTRPGFYYTDDDMTIAGYAGNRWWMEVFAYGAGTSFATQRICSFWNGKGCVAERHKVNQTWSEWGWVNPPLELGKEYLTTETVNGKAVWTVYANIGTMSSSPMNIRLTQYPATEVVRYMGTCRTTTIPSIYGDLNNGWTIYAFVNLNNDAIQARIYAGTEFTGRAVYMQFWYTKD